MPDIDCTFVRLNELSVVIKDDRDRTVTLPRSQIEGDLEDHEEGDAITIEVPEWLAKNEGLI